MIVHVRPSGMGKRASPSSQPFYPRFIRLFPMAANSGLLTLPALSAVSPGDGRAETPHPTPGFLRVPAHPEPHQRLFGAGAAPTMTCTTLWQRRRAGYGKVAAEQARAAARKGDRAAAAQIPSADTGQ